MVGAKLEMLVILLISFAAIIIPAALSAHVGVYDEWWTQRAEMAMNNTLETYEPSPETVTNHTNEQVHMALSWRSLEETSTNSTRITNSTRRELKGKRYRGPCMATNPIDKCWRCQPNWANNRKRLADCGLGFGKKAIGGKKGRIYVVIDPSDNDMVNPKVGTLRHAVIQKEPLWIVFARSMVIRLNQELIMQGDKTIDGRGAKVHIAHGAGFTIQFVNNVIIHGLHIHDIHQGTGGMIRDSVDHYGFRMNSDGDGISIFGSTNVWIDHVSMWNCKDGLIDAIEGSTGITISNSHFTDHNDVMLLGANNMQTKDKLLQVTIAFNHFGKRLIQRMPRVRYGFVHVVNNDYTHWNMYAIGGSQAPSIISQGNRFIAPLNDRLKEITKRELAQESEWKHWHWRSEGDLLMNGAFFVESGSPDAIQKYSQRFNLVQAAPGTQVTWITRFSGSLNCLVGKPC